MSRQLVRKTSDINLPTVARRTAGGLKLMRWLIEADVARDVTRTVEGGKLSRSEQEIFGLADGVLGAIRAYHLNPVLVMDDTDRILTARVRFANARRTANDAFAEGALEELFDVYEGLNEKSIRAVLATAHAALARAQEALAPAISADHVKVGADDALLT